MAKLVVDDLFHGKPERVRYVEGGYGGSKTGAHSHYSDGDDDYSSHRHSGQAPTVLIPSSAAGRTMLPAQRFFVDWHGKVQPSLDVEYVIVEGEDHRLFLVLDVRLSVPMDSTQCVEKVKEGGGTVKKKRVSHNTPNLERPFDSDPPLYYVANFFKKNP